MSLACSFIMIDDTYVFLVQQAYTAVNFKISGCLSFLHKHGLLIYSNELRDVGL